jgi:hypothetical protein
MATRFELSFSGDKWELARMVRGRKHETFSASLAYWAVRNALAGGIGLAESTIIYSATGGRMGTAGAMSLDTYNPNHSIPFSFDHAEDWVTPLIAAGKCIICETGEAEALGDMCAECSASWDDYCAMEYRIFLLEWESTNTGEDWRELIGFARADVIGDVPTQLWMGR